MFIMCYNSSAETPSISSFFFCHMISQKSSQELYLASRLPSFHFSSLWTLFFNNVILFWLSYSPKHSNLAGSLVTCLWTYSCLPKSKVIYDDQDYIPHAPHHIYQTSVLMSLNHHHHRARLMPALTAFQLLRKRVFYFWVGLQVRQVFLSGLLNSPTCII